MNRFEGYITAHIGDSINECDDNFAFKLNNSTFAIADGSSSDFFSKIYSQMLADNFVEGPKNFYTNEVISRINEEWHSAVKSKLEEAGCKPGSFPYVRFQKRDPGCSTLIGLRFYKEDEKVMYCCSGLGDSVLFFVPEKTNIPTLQFSSYSNETFSFDQNIEFGYTPILSRSYSTQWLGSVKEFSDILTKGIFYLMTDGMAEWVLRNDNGTIEEKFEALNLIHSQEEFLSYVEMIRDKGAHNDDMTLVKIYIDEINTKFNSKESRFYNYREEQSKYELKEVEERQKKRIEEAKKSNSALLPDSLSWITKVVDTQKKKKEEIENGNDNLDDDSKNSPIISTNGDDIQQNVEHEGKKDIQNKQDSAGNQNALISESDMSNNENDDEQNSGNLPLLNDEKKKHFNGIIKENTSLLIIVFLIISNTCSIISNQLRRKEFNREREEISALVSTHKIDSTQIITLSNQIKMLIEENERLTDEVSVYKKREEYLKTFPTAYNNVITIK